MNAHFFIIDCTVQATAIKVNVGFKLYSWNRKLTHWKKTSTKTESCSFHLKGKGLLVEATRYRISKSKWALNATNGIFDENPPETDYLST